MHRFRHKIPHHRPRTYSRLFSNAFRPRSRSVITTKGPWNDKKHERAADHYPVDKIDPKQTAHPPFSPSGEIRIFDPDTLLTFNHCLEKRGDSPQIYHYHQQNEQKEQDDEHNSSARTFGEKLGKSGHEDKNQHCCHRNGHHTQKGFEAAAVKSPCRAEKAAYAQKSASHWRGRNHNVRIDFVHFCYLIIFSSKPSLLL